MTFRRENKNPNGKKNNVCLRIYFLHLGFDTSVLAFRVNYSIQNAYMGKITLFMKFLFSPHHLGIAEPTNSLANILPIFQNELLSKAQQERLSTERSVGNCEADRSVVFMRSNYKCHPARLSLSLGFTFPCDLCWNDLELVGTLSP